MNAVAMTKPVPILMYHSISDGEVAPRYRPYAVRPSSFERQVAHIRENGYTALSVSGFVRARTDGTLPERSIVITIDDGLADFYQNALPILMKHGVTATLYVVTGLVGGRCVWLDVRGEGHRPMLTWEQIGEISRCGIECGAHTHNHPELDVLPAEAARKEILESKVALEARLGRSVASFAYPYGKYCRRVREMVQAAGFTSACAVKHALSSTDDDPFSLARIQVPPDVPLATFEQWLQGRGMRRAPQRQTVAKIAWRLARRAALRLRARRPPQPMAR
jgi:peptidoglycan/xylan/chitin deacetylase (PgdA/CDA1 family)